MKTKKPYTEEERERRRERERVRRAKNPEKSRESTRQWRAKNHEKSKEMSQQWRAKNHEKSKEMSQQWRAKNSEKSREYHIKRKYNLTLSDLNRMIEEQNHCCQICRQPFEWSNTWLSPVVDHCHKTGKVRGILHQKCNAALGQFDDNQSFLRGALDYLHKHSS